MLGTGKEKKMEPITEPAVFFHTHQENYAISADDGAKHPLASPNASACQIALWAFASAGDGGMNSSSHFMAKYHGGGIVSSS